MKPRKTGSKRAGFFVLDYYKNLFFFCNFYCGLSTIILKAKEDNMKICLVGAMAFCLAACMGDGSSVSDEVLYVTTDKSDYKRNEKTVIAIHNGTDRTVVFQGCLSDVFYYRDRWVEEEWVEWTSLYCSDTVKVIFILGPRSSLSDSIVVHKPGDYRFRLPLNWDSPNGMPDMISSNSFTIH